MMGLSNLFRRHAAPGHEALSNLPGPAPKESAPPGPSGVDSSVLTRTQGSDTRSASPIRVADLSGKPGWQEVPPLASLVSAMPLVVTTDFDRYLGSRMSVLTVAPNLGHILSPAAPSGLVDLVVTSMQAPPPAGTFPDSLPALDVARTDPARSGRSGVSGSGVSQWHHVFDAPEDHTGVPEIAFTDAGRYVQVAPARPAPAVPARAASVAPALAQVTPTQAPPVSPTPPRGQSALSSSGSATGRARLEATADVSAAESPQVAASRPTLTDDLASPPPASLVTAVAPVAPSTQASTSDTPTSTTPAFGRAPDGGAQLPLPVAVTRNMVAVGTEGRLPRVGTFIPVEPVDTNSRFVSAAMPPTLSLVQLPAERMLALEGEVPGAVMQPVGGLSEEALPAQGTPSGATGAAIEPLSGMPQGPASPAVALVEGEAPILSGSDYASGSPALPETPSASRSATTGESQPFAVRSEPNGAAQRTERQSFEPAAHRRPGLGAPLAGLPPTAETLDPSEMALSPEGRRRLTAALRTTMAPSLDLSRAGTPGESQPGAPAATPPLGALPASGPTGFGQFSSRSVPPERSAPVGSANSWAGLPLVSAVQVPPVHVALERFVEASLVSPAEISWPALRGGASAEVAVGGATVAELPAGPDVDAAPDSGPYISEPLVYAPAAPGDPSAGPPRLPSTAIPVDVAVLPLLGQGSTWSARVTGTSQGAQQRPSGMVEGSSVRSAVGHRHGVDLSSVPVDRSNSAFVTAERMGARGFTTDAGIAIPRQAGSLDDGPGAALLAHELTHVAQRMRGDRPTFEGSQEGRGLEAEALRAEAAQRLTSPATGPLAVASRRQVGSAPQPFAGLTPVGSRVATGNALPLAYPSLSWSSTSPGGWDRSTGTVSQPAVSSAPSTSIVSAPAPPAAASASAPALTGAGVQMATKGSEPSPAATQPSPAPLNSPDNDVFDKRPTEAQLSRLASWLYPLIVYKLRSEIRQGRERSGLLTDTYRRW